MKPCPAHIHTAFRYVFLFVILLTASRLFAVIDVGVSAIIAPVSGCGLTGEEYVVVQVTNYGTVMVDGFPVTYQFEGGATVSEIEGLPLMPGDSINVFFAIPIDLSLPGVYNLCAWTDAPDADASDDSLCTTIESLVTPSVELGPDMDICGDVTLDAGSPGLLYAWNTGAVTQTITVDTTGNYSVVVTEPSSGCTVTDSVFITAIPEPIADFTYTITDFTYYFTNNSTGAETYEWDFGDGSTSTEVNPSHTYTLSGTYNVSLSATNLCNTDIYSDMAILENIHAAPSPHSFLIYPNPAKNFIYLASDDIRKTRLEVFNLYHQTVYEQLITEKESMIPLSEFESGLFLVELWNDNLLIQTGKLAIIK